MWACGCVCSKSWPRTSRCLSLLSQQLCSQKRWPSGWGGPITVYFTVSIWRKAGEHTPGAHPYKIQMESVSLQRDLLVRGSRAKSAGMQPRPSLESRCRGGPVHRLQQCIPAHSPPCRSPDPLLIWSPSVTLQTQRPLPQYFQQPTSDYPFMTLQHSFSWNFMAFH